MHSDLEDFQWQETLTIYINGHISFSKVSKRCSIRECSSNESSDIKGVQSGTQGRCHSDCSRLMSNGEVVRIVTIEPKVVSIRSDGLRAFHSESNSHHCASNACLASIKIVGFVMTLVEVNVGM